MSKTSDHRLLQRLKNCKTKELLDFKCSKVYLYLHEIIEHILSKNFQN